MLTVSSLMNVMKEHDKSGEVVIVKDENGYHVGIRLHDDECHVIYLTNIVDVLSYEKIL